MKKIYILFLASFVFQHSFSQCPIIDGAMVNSCGTQANNEGINEFVLFTTTAAANSGDYKISYGSNNPATNNPSGVLNGASAGPKTGNGTFKTTGSCLINEITSATSLIPANSRVIFIPANFDTTYDVTAICVGGVMYVVYITTTPNTWNPQGTLANAPAANRYFQISNGAEACASGIRSFNNGWPENKDGNFVAWDATGTATYLNNGCTSIVTPVKLLSFSANAAGKNANISWQTATEENTKAFVIERSSDGINFAIIGTIDAAGNSTAVKNYSITDVNIPTGPSYYRLKMIDMDGTAKFSRIVRILTITNSFAITNIFPQPAINQIGISWHSPRSGKTIATIYDYTGRQLSTESIIATAGMNFHQVQIHTLPKGQYLIKLLKDNETLVSRFSKM